MAVSHEEVVWGYRAILGREPESEQVISQHMCLPDFSALRSALLNSQEFNLNSPVLGVGRHRAVDGCQIETVCSAADLARMSENIAREWRKFGETEPHWSVATANEFKSENINQNLEAFYDLGTDDVGYVIAALKRNGIWKGGSARALDFGCGVGRLSLALAPHVLHVTGIDISAAHLVHARQRAEQTGVRNVTFEPIDTIDGIDALPQFDLIISLIVLQHNPPPVMVVLFKKLLARLAAGGVAVIQIPTYIVGQQFTVNEYLTSEQPSMEMNAVPQRVIYEAAEHADCKVMEVREDGYMGTDIGLSHTFVIQRR
jgi:2-polyprenyl-3-methyl-5-hydroxy-6-metoxy-1,4-benzoquinol methylase